MNEVFAWMGWLLAIVALLCSWVVWREVRWWIAYHRRTHDADYAALLASYARYDRLFLLATILTQHVRDPKFADHLWQTYAAEQPKADA